MNTKAIHDLIEQIKIDVGDRDKVKQGLGGNVERARLSIMAIFKDIQARCNTQIIDSQGNVVGSINFSDIFNAFSLEELAAMQLSIAGNLSYLSFVLGNLTLDVGLDEKTVALTHTQAYEKTLDLITAESKKKPTEKYIKSIIDQELYDVNVRLVQNATALKYIETIYKAGEHVRNVLQAVVNVKLDDKINDYQMGKNLGVS